MTAGERAALAFLAGLDPDRLASRQEMVRACRAVAGPRIDPVPPLLFDGFIDIQPGRHTYKAPCLRITAAGRAALARPKVA